jgi:hypothetical protein
MRKVFKHFYMYSLQSQKNTSIQAFLEIQRQNRLKEKFFQILKFFSNQKIVLRERKAIYEVLKFKKLLLFLKLYSVNKQSERKDYLIKFMKL